MTGALTTIGQTPGAAALAAIDRNPDLPTAQRCNTKRGHQLPGRRGAGQLSADAAPVGAGVLEGSGENVGRGRQPPL
jgi:hypothetical protein